MEKLDSKELRDYAGLVFPISMKSSCSRICGLCRSPVIQDKWTQVTHADHDGNPVEATGYGLYCTSSSCPMSVEALEDEHSSPPASMTNMRDLDEALAPLDSLYADWKRLGLKAGHLTQEDIDHAEWDALDPEERAAHLSACDGCDDPDYPPER